MQNNDKFGDWRLIVFWAAIAVAAGIAGFTLGWLWRDRPEALLGLTLLVAFIAAGVGGSLTLEKRKSRSGDKNPQPIESTQQPWKRVREWLGLPVTIGEPRKLARLEIEVDSYIAGFYETIYFDSLETREKLVARVQIPMAISLSLVGAQAYMFLGLDSAGRGWYFWGHVAFFCLALTSIILAMIHFFRVLTGHSYRYVSVPMDFETLRESSINSFKGKSENDEWLEHWTNDTVRHEAIFQMASCASYNALRNDVRSGHSSRGHVLVLLSGIFTAISFTTYQLGDLRTIPVHKVELVTEEGKTPHKVDISD